MNLYEWPTPTPAPKRKRREGSHFKIWEGQSRARWIINKIYDEYFLSEMPGVRRNADRADLKWK